MTSHIFRGFILQAPHRAVDGSSVFPACGAFHAFRALRVIYAWQYRDIPVNCLQFVCTYFDNVIMFFFFFL